MRTNAIAKTSDTGRFEGPLIVFSDGKVRDTQGEWFDPWTVFGFAGRKSIETPLFYHHGRDAGIGLTVIGSGTLSRRPDSIWLEGRIEPNRPYSDAIGELIDAGALGLSSGSGTHLIEVEGTKARGMGGRIARWPLGLDASLTPAPADPRTFAVRKKGELEVACEMAAKLRATGKSARCSPPPPGGVVYPFSSTVDRASGGAVYAFSSVVGVKMKAYRMKSGLAAVKFDAGSFDAQPWLITQLKARKAYLVEIAKRAKAGLLGEYVPSLDALKARQDSARRCGELESRLTDSRRASFKLFVTDLRART